MKSRVTGWIAPAPIIGMMLIGCSTPPEPSAEACLKIFQARINPAEVVHMTAESSPDRVWIGYQIDNRSARPTPGTFECRLRRAKTGGVRIDSVTNNGERLGENWVTVANADLMLEDLQRYGAMEPRS